MASSIATVDGAGVIRYIEVTGTGSPGDPYRFTQTLAEVIPGTAAADLGKAEDAAHTSGDTGVMALTVRKDAAAATAGTDGDYQPPITDASGRLWANVGQVTPGVTATSLGKAEDAAHASGDTGVFALAVRNDAGTALAGTDGDYIPLSTDSAGNLRVTSGGGGLSANVGGDTAHDAVDAGNPVKIGGYAKSTAPTNVSADGDRVNAWFDLAGRLAVQDGGGSLTVDGSVTADTELTTADLDTGAGTDTRAVVGIAQAESGGALLVGSAHPLQVTLANTGANATAVKTDGSAVTQPVSGTVSLTDINNGEYETVAASATDQALGATGATGDYLAGVLIVPATTSPGAVSIKDGSGSAITVFTGGASSVSNLVPFFVPLGIKSTGGAWKVTTGTSVSAIGTGNFT